MRRQAWNMCSAVEGKLLVLNPYIKCISFFPVLIEPIPTKQAAKDYLNLYVIPTLLKGLTALSKKKPADPFVCITRKTRIKRQNEYEITIALLC